MTTPYVGEIRCYGFNFAPRGWFLCQGQLLPIAQYQTLFAIIGTTYGGNGQNNFALPNLQGQVPMHWGNTTWGMNTVLGEVFGQPSVTLLLSEMAQHPHLPVAAQIASGAQGERTAAPGPASYLSSSSAPNVAYETTPATVNSLFSPKTISLAGGSQPHENMQPYLAASFCIAYEGIFPSPN